jgi:hypothetical protein
MQNYQILIEQQIFCKSNISDENLAAATLDVIFHVKTPLFGDVTRKSVERDFKYVQYYKNKKKMEHSKNIKVIAENIQLRFF